MAPGTLAAAMLLAIAATAAVGEPAPPRPGEGAEEACLIQRKIGAAQMDAHPATGPEEGGSGSGERVAASIDGVSVFWKGPAQSTKSKAVAGTVAAESIAGVPVFRQNAAGSQNRSTWMVRFHGNATNADVGALRKSGSGACDVVFEGSPDFGGLPILVIRATEAELAEVLPLVGEKAKYVAEDGALRIPLEEIKLSEQEEASREEQVNPPSWGLDRIDDRLGLDGSYEPRHKRAGAGVHVFVLDTGLRDTHVDFEDRADRLLEVNDAGLRLCARGATGCAEDRSGHGTHVAGTVAGKTYGVAKKSWLHGVKICDDAGFCYYSWIYQALDWILCAKLMRPAVVSMSLGGFYSSGVPPELGEFFDDVTRAGIVVVAAAGNEQNSACTVVPAAYASVIAVGATMPLDDRTWWSNYGPCVDLFAPGDGIISAWYLSDTGRAIASGTSMSCPHVSGAAALELAENFLHTPAAVKAILVGSATPRVVQDARAGSPNKLLYVGPLLGEAKHEAQNSSAAALEEEGGERAAGERGFCPPHRLSFEVVEGPCTVDSCGCALSSNFPKPYGDNEFCTIRAAGGAGSGSGRLSVQSFSTEDFFDALTVNGRVYWGPNTLDAAYLDGEMLQGDITWTSDKSVSYSGWKLCLTRPGFPKSE